eukprot:1140657-Pelagomonas_calceolata.AAC.3
MVFASVTRIVAVLKRKSFPHKAPLLEIELGGGDARCFGPSSPRKEYSKSAPGSWAKGKVGDDGLNKLLEEREERICAYPDSQARARNIA